MNNKKMMKILSISMAIMIGTSSITFAEGITKDETVYVNLTASGDARNAIVSDWLHCDDKDVQVKDKTILKDIINVKGNEKPEINGEDITWNIKDNDLFYQGTTDKELPIRIEIIYYLDGKQIDAKELADKSGKLKMTVEIKNNDAHNVTINNKSKKLYTPFSSIAIVNFPIDKFKNVKINTGELICDADNQVITYISIPGIKESIGNNNNFVDIPDRLEVTADVDKFEMGSVIITATSKIPNIKDLKEIDKVSDLVDGIGQLKDASEKLSEGTSKLSAGQEELSKSIDKFEMGLKQLDFGTVKLKNGALEIAKGANDAHEGALSVANGVKLLVENSGKLGEGMVQFGNGAVEFGSKSDEFAKGASQVALGVSTIAGKTDELNNGAKALTQGSDALINGQNQLTEGIKQSLQGIEKLKSGKQKEIEVLNLLLNGVDGLIGTTSMLTTVPIVKDSAEKIVEALNKQKEGLAGLIKSGDEYLMGIEQVEVGLATVQAGSEKLSSEMAKLNQGQQMLSAGISKINEGATQLKPAADKLTEGSMGLSEGAEKLGQSAEQINAGSKQFVEKSQELVVGSEKVAEGIGKLAIGANTFANGAEELGNASNKLATGSVMLKNGAEKLNAGTKELDVNMKKFHTEGVCKLYNEVNGKIGDVEDLIDVKDGLVKLSDEYQSFSGISSDVEGKVKFVMKTDEIKIPKVEKDNLTNTKKHDDSFFTWLKNKLSSIF